jgi:hypothetical protein
MEAKKAAGRYALFPGKRWMQKESLLVCKDDAPVVRRRLCTSMAGELKPATGGICDARVIPDRGSEDGVV